MDTEPDAGHPPPPEAKPVEPEKAPEPEHPHEPPPVPEAEADRAFRAGFWAKLLVFLFVVGYSIAFIVGNDKTISVDFVFATARVSLIWTILLLLAVGLFGGALLAQLARHRRGKQRRKP